MPKEIETKFKIDSAPAFRKKLKAIKAEFVSRNLERDVYYLPSGFKISAGVVRLRWTGGNKGFFTVKMRGCGGGGPFKVREELEVGIDNTETFDSMLRAMGFVTAFVKEKRRETYIRGDAKILLDELPYIGWYAEIEGPKRSIRKLAGLLDLDMDKAIPDTYMQLFGYYKAMRGKRELQLVFNE